MWIGVSILAPRGALHLARPSRLSFVTPKWGSCRPTSGEGSGHCGSSSPRCGFPKCRAVPKPVPGREERYAEYLYLGCRPGTRETRLPAGGALGIPCHTNLNYNSSTDLNIRRRVELALGRARFQGLFGGLAGQRPKIEDVAVRSGADPGQFVKDSYCHESLKCQGTSVPPTGYCVELVVSYVQAKG